MIAEDDVPPSTKASIFSRCSTSFPHFSSQQSHNHARAPVQKMRQQSSDPEPQRAPHKRRQAHAAPPRPINHDGSTGLKQVEYRSYQHDIKIYHFRTYITLDEIRTFLTRERHDSKKPQHLKHGYVDALIGPDTLANNHFVPEGDDIPADCIEVAYLHGIFPYAMRRIPPGSALGFRAGNNIIEWACFDRPIEDTILNSWVWDPSASQVDLVTTTSPNDPRRLFDFVASMPKGLRERRVKGANDEHKQWHESLWAARLRPLKLKLTWNDRVTKLVDMQDVAREKLEEEIQRKRLEMEGDDMETEMAGEYI